MDHNSNDFIAGIIFGIGMCVAAYLVTAASW